ncbi:MAG: 50S ribosomal protein L20 [Acidobacteria bacterium]|nr:MAG: 50S ribosomal protein L20 [Acidobacteriota bacterium]TDI15736.1 MAG: 50S ribosomal protein L20 [Acidobacteriota bacterium]
MSRVRRGNKRLLRRKKILKQAKGYWGTKSKLHKAAKQQVLRSLAYAYRDRRQKKRQFRRLWIIRIAAAARQHGYSYSRLIHGLNKAGMSLNRKVLADLAVRDSKAFEEIVRTAQEAVATHPQPPLEAT